MTCSLTTRPSNRLTTRCAYSASDGECVTMTIVVPAAFSSARRSITAVPFWLSRLPVGSSASRSEGPATTARAIATRCC